MVYSDHIKVFDVVFYALLLQKLQMLGFDTCLIDWLQPFLRWQDMSASVAWNLSKEVTVTSGVPQGSVIGSL